MTTHTTTSVEPQPRSLPIPQYLEKLYWWAYIHPRAVRIFEREWLVNVILLGNYHRLREAALAALGNRVCGRTLQLGCVYGNLTSRLRMRLAPDAALDVVDILPIQLENLRRKLPADARVCLMQGDASSLAGADGRYDQVLLFFLLHEQPEAIRRKTLSEALRVTRPGGRIVIVDYHRPVRLHPLRPLLRLLLGRLKPYATDLWRGALDGFLPGGATITTVGHTTYFGNLYQLLVIVR